MTEPSAERCRQIVGRFPRARILVVGDLMLDRFVSGIVERISPEAPVPVVRVRARKDHPGGAGNVAANLRDLGGQVELLGVIGDDEAGARLRAGLEARGVETGGVLVSAERGTTVKSRVVAHHQQVVRIDDEQDGPLPEEVASALLRGLLERLGGASLLIVSDYSKGVISPALLREVLPEAHRRGLGVVVDPKVPNMAHYQPATVVTPNEAEAARATGREFREAGDALAAARDLLGRLRIEALLMTLGDRGMLLCPREGEPVEIPTAAREVYDVTGAGDTVVAALALALASGAGLAEAASLANRAASVVVGKLGTATCSAQELLRAAASPVSES